MSLVNRAIKAEQLWKKLQGGKNAGNRKCVTAFLVTMLTYAKLDNK
jgi:hypothetical protein